MTKCYLPTSRSSPQTRGRGGGGREKKKGEDYRLSLKRSAKAPTSIPIIRSTKIKGEEKREGKSSPSENFTLSILSRGEGGGKKEGGKKSNRQREGGGNANSLVYCGGGGKREKGKKKKKRGGDSVLKKTFSS